jgi:hypothetical protein
MVLLLLLKRALRIRKGGANSAISIKLTIPFMLHARWESWQWRFRRGQTRTWLQIRLLIDTQDSLPPGKRAGGEFDQGLDLLGKALITRHPGGEPQVRAPRFELVGLQDSADGLEGNAGHDAIGLELTGEFGAVPLGQGTPKLIRPFTSPLDHIECDLR